MVICKICGINEAVNDKIGLCSGCLAHRKRGSENLGITFAEFKEKYLKDTAAGLFWAEDALIQYSFYKRDHKFIPFLSDEYGQYRGEHNKLREWYTVNIFSLLKERIQAFADENNETFSTDTLDAFVSFHERANTIQNVYGSQLVNVLLKRKIIETYEGRHHHGTKDTEKPSYESVDIAVNRFSTGSVFYFLEIFSNLYAYDATYLPDFIFDVSEFFKNNKVQELADIASQPKLLLTPWKHQVQAITNWNEMGHNGVVEMATATGKTLVGMLAIEELWKVLIQSSQNLKRSAIVLIICNSTVILNQWRREIIRKMGLFDNTSSSFTADLAINRITIKFQTVQTLMRHTDMYPFVDLLIIDEVHHMAAPEFIKALDVKCNWKLGLTASLIKQESRALVTSNVGKIVFQYPISAALRDGIIPQFSWVVHPTYLDIYEEDEYSRITVAIANQFKFVRNDFDTISLITGVRATQPLRNIGDFVRLTELARFKGKLDELPDEWKILQANLFKRRQIINKSKPRREKAEQLASELGNEHKIILFLMDIESCDQMHAALSKTLDNVFVIHSKIKGDPIDVVEQFKRAEHGVLIGANMLNEGIDIPSADIGINVAFTKSELQLIQRMGRVLRKDGKKRPTFYQFVALPDTDFFVPILDAEDSMNDLAWVQATALRLGLDVKVEWNSAELLKYKDELEKYWSELWKAPTSIPDRVGSFNLKKYIEELSKTAITRLPDLLSLYTDKITDAQWDDLLRTAHMQVDTASGEIIDYLEKSKTRVDAANSWYILIYCDRDPAKLNEIFTKAASGIPHDRRIPLPPFKLNDEGMLILDKGKQYCCNNQNLTQPVQNLEKKIYPSIPDIKFDRRDDNHVSNTVVKSENENPILFSGSEKEVTLDMKTTKYHSVFRYGYYITNITAEQASVLLHKRRNDSFISKWSITIRYFIKDDWKSYQSCWHKAECEIERYNNNTYGLKWTKKSYFNIYMIMKNKSGIAKLIREDRTTFRLEWQ